MLTATCNFCSTFRHGETGGLLSLCFLSPAQSVCVCVPRAVSIQALSVNDLISNRASSTAGALIASQLNSSRMRLQYKAKWKVRAICQSFNCRRKHLAPSLTISPSLSHFFFKSSDFMFIYFNSLLLSSCVCVCVTVCV